MRSTALNDIQLLPTNLPRPGKVLFPQVKVHFRHSSHRRGHWFDPSIAHGLGRRMSAESADRVARRRIWGPKPPDPHGAIGYGTSVGSVARAARIGVEWSGPNLGV
jgi:hypothetical protein